MVALFHFNRRDGDGLSAFLNHCNLGVEVFFVISGFIIPLAMSWTHFRYVDAWNFLLRRFLRLYPMFALMVVVEICLYYFGQSWFGYSSHPEDITWSRTMANFSLSAEALGIRWYIPVFWSLAIEMQYYLLIVLSFPLLYGRSPWLRYATILAWIVAPLIAGNGATVFTWSALFIMGILVFLYREKKIGHLGFWLCFAASCYAQYDVRGQYAVGAGLITSMIILYFPNLKSKLFGTIGEASYSLYLTHITIGGAIMFQLRWLPGGWLSHVLALAVTITISTALAHVCYRYLELPTHLFARRFKTKFRKAEIASTLGNS